MFNSLAIAAFNNDVDIIKTLLEFGVPIHADGDVPSDNAFWVAGRKGFVETVEILWDASKLAIDPSRLTLFLKSALRGAASQGHLQVVHFLLSIGAEVNGITRINNSDETALREASGSGQTSMVQLLLSKGALINLNGNKYALMSAALEGHEEIVRILLSAGADVKVSDREPKDFIPKLLPPDSFLLGGWRGKGSISQKTHHIEPWVRRVYDADTNIEDGVFGGAIQTAASAGHDSIVALLLDHGLDPNDRDEEIPTPLQCACYKGRESTVRLLIHRGADVHATGGLYMSPLHAASLGGRLAIVELLLEYGVEVNTEKRLGTPLEAALLGALVPNRYQGPFRAIARRLHEAGAEPKSDQRLEGLLRATEWRGEPPCMPLCLEGLPE
ncbi:MAG: hypothetical protein Q9224_006731 [Gallowayella concinna]